MNIRLLTVAALGTALTAGALTVAPTAAAPKKPLQQCMTDDGFGRFRPCSALYKREHPNWRAGPKCMTDDGYGRMRPCSSLYRQGDANPGQYGTNSTFPKSSKPQPL